MKNTGTLRVTVPADCTVVLERVFDAPRELVFDALTKPELIRRWFGPRGTSLSVCEVDFRPGGAWYYLLHSDRGDLGIRGVYREIEAPQRIVSTESFDGFPGEAVATLTLVERDGKTTMTNTVISESNEIRDGHLANGMEDGAAETYDRLAECVATLQQTSP
jgi:uncharacterized protein YndB with AHSA1/START domain